jgi:K+-sensing histidine kinase KdpD
MLGVAFVIANLMANGQRQTEAASRRERRTAVLGAADAMTIANIAARHVAASLEGLAMVLLPDEQGRATSHQPAGECYEAYSSGYLDRDPREQSRYQHRFLLPARLPRMRMSRERNITIS